jgi:hypothetical protein
LKGVFFADGHGSLPIKYREGEEAKKSSACLPAGKKFSRWGNFASLKNILGLTYFVTHV